MAKPTTQGNYEPTAAAAARWLGVKVAAIQHATPGLRIKSPSKPGRYATFLGQHPQPEDWLGNSWWLLEQEEQNKAIDDALRPYPGAPNFSDWLKQQEAQG